MRVVAVALIAGLISSGLVVLPTTAAARPAVAADPDPVADGSKSAEDFALERAKATGRPFELTSARTESSDTWALPDGTWSLKRYGTPVRMLRDGAWVPTDATLAFKADGSVAPRAATVAVTFSGGGTGPLLSGVKDGRTLTLTWPSALPKPTLADNVATYSEVLPGVDLQLKAEVEGFSQLLVVKSAEAAKNPQLASLKYKLDTVGLNVSTDEQTGSITAVNPAGQTVFTSPTPLMWDSTTTSSATVPQGAKFAKSALSATDTAPDAPATVFDPAPGAKDAQMPTTVSGDSLEIKPDQALLTDAGTKYPVFIDPTWAWGQRQNWTRVYKKYPNTSFWNTKDVVRVGYEAETNGLSRSFFQMDTSNIKGAQVKSSTFRVKNTWSWSCQARPVELWSVGAISSKTTWNNQPARGTRLNTVNESKGWSKDCAAGNLEFDATAKVREAASKSWSSLNLGLYAGDEGDTFGWKKFDAKTATLETVYNNPPKTPSALGTNPKTSCSAGGLIGNTRISLYATIDDPDAGNLTAQFQVFKAGATTPTITQSIPAAKGKVATWSVPDVNLPTGDYTWKVQAKDPDGATSSWSNACKFSVDRTRPSKPPVIASTQFPSGENGWPTNSDGSSATGKARTPGTFSFDANGVTDVSRFTWWTDYEPTPVEATPGVPVTVQPPGYGPHFVYAYSVDKAGNRSDTTTYIYYASRSQDRDGPNDLNGDGNSDIWNIDSNGTLLTYAGQGNTQFSTAANGGGSFDGGQVTARGDWGQDGYNDLVALQYDSTEKRKVLRAYPNNGQGVVRSDPIGLSVACPVKDADLGCDFGPDWTGDDHWFDADQIIAPGDINNDPQHNSDLLVKEGKQLWAYYGSRAADTLDNDNGPVLVGNGDWDKYTVVAPGDLNGDGIVDLWLRDNATGDVFRSDGRKGANGNLDPTTWGDAANRVKIGAGFTAAAFPSIGSVGDITGDGLPDLWARKTDNSMIGWPGRVPAGSSYAFGDSFIIDGITGGSRIPAGTTLSSGKSFASRSAKLTMQDDGNLVISSVANKQLWSTNTAGNPGATAIVQSDGNVVVYKADGTTKLWETKTAAPGGYALLQDRGNLVVYNVKSQSLWSSGSAIRHDYNGDGRSDMASWYTYGDGHSAFQTFLTNSDGTFKQPFSSYSSGVGSWNVNSMRFTTGDYNGDGRGDAAMTYDYGNGLMKVYTAFGKPDGGFQFPVLSYTSAKGSWYVGSMTLESGDFNGDGRDDLGIWYSYSDGSDRLFTLTADVRGGFNSPFGGSTMPAGWWDAKHAKTVTGDFNGDGRDDLAAWYVYDDGTAKVWTYFATPTGGLDGGVVSYTNSNWADLNRIDLQAGDFNNDGVDDLALWYDYADGHDGVAAYFYDGKHGGKITSSTTAWLSAAGNFDHNHMRLTTGDFNGDGLDDIGAMYGYSDGTSKMLTWITKPDATLNHPLDGYTFTTPASWSFAANTMLRPYN